MTPLLLASVGMSEVLIILLIGVLYSVPIIIVCWALRTLWRMYQAQVSILARLSSIEDLLRTHRT
jgi:hypothetical protein